MNKMKLPVSMLLLMVMVIVFPVQVSADVSVGQGGNNTVNTDDGFILSEATEQTYKAPSFGPGCETALPTSSYFFTSNPDVKQTSVSSIEYQGVTYTPTLFYVTDGAMTQIKDPNVVRANYGMLQNGNTYFFDAVDNNNNPLEYQFYNTSGAAIVQGDSFSGYKTQMIGPDNAGIIGYDRSGGDTKPEFHKEGESNEHLIAFRIMGTDLYIDNISFDGDSRNMISATHFPADGNVYGCGLINIGGGDRLTIINCEIKNVGTPGAYLPFTTKNCRNMGISIDNAGQVNLENISMSSLNTQQSSNSAPLRIMRSKGVYVNSMDIDMSDVGDISVPQLNDYVLSPFPVKIDGGTSSAITTVWIDDLNVTNMPNNLLSQTNRGIAIENYDTNNIYLPEEYRYSALGTDINPNAGVIGIAMNYDCLNDLITNELLNSLDLNLDFDTQMVYDNVDNAWVINEDWNTISQPPTVQKQFDTISDILDKTAESGNYPSEVWYKYIFSDDTKDEIDETGFTGLEISDVNENIERQNVVFGYDMDENMGQLTQNDLIPVTTDASFVLPEDQLGILHNLDFTMSKYEDNENISGTMSRVLKGIAPNAVPVTDPLDTGTYPFKYTDYVKSEDNIVDNGTYNSFRNCKFDGLVRNVEVRNSSNSIISSMNVSTKAKVALKASVPGSNDAIYTDTTLTDKLPKNITVDRSKVDQGIEWFVVSDGTKSGVAKGTRIGTGNNINYTMGSNEGTVQLLAKATDSNNSGELEKPYKTVTLKATKNVTKISTPMSSVTMKKGKTYTPAIVLYDGKNIISSKLTFTSGNTKVATVSSSGKIKAVKKGKTTVTVKSANGKTLKIKVNVVTKAKALKSFKISGVKSKLRKGKTAVIKIKVKPSTAAITKVKFKSSKSKIIKVDKAGKITALKKGKAKITVTVNGKKVTKTIKVV